MEPKPHLKARIAHLRSKYAAQRVELRKSKATVYQPDLHPDSQVRERRRSAKLKGASVREEAKRAEDESEDDEEIGGEGESELPYMVDILQADIRDKAAITRNSMGSGHNSEDLLQEK